MSSEIWRHVTNLLPPSSGQVCITTRLTSRYRQSGGASETSVHFHQTIRRHVPQDINHYHHKNMENLLALLHCEDGGATNCQDGGATNLRHVRKYSDDNGWRHIQDDLTFSHTVVRSLDHSLRSLITQTTQITHSLTQIIHSHIQITHSLRSPTPLFRTFTPTLRSLTHSLTQITHSLTQTTHSHSDHSPPHSDHSLTRITQSLTQIIHSLTQTTHSHHSLPHSDHSLPHSDHSLTHSPRSPNPSLRSFTHSLRSLTQATHSLRSLTPSLRPLTPSLTHKVSQPLSPAIWPTPQHSPLPKDIKLPTYQSHVTHPTRRTTPDSSNPTQPETKTNHNY